VSDYPTAVTVGGAARRAGLTPKAVRLYEARGLLPAAQRSGSGYRLYSEYDVEVLKFIRQARALSLSLEEIKEIIDLRREGLCPCGRVTDLVDRHLERVDHALADLGAVRDVLLQAKAIAASGSNGVQNPVICQIIESQHQARGGQPGSASPS
jgi:DNA-binding transcriptional MerR regulator